MKPFIAIEKRSEGDQYFYWDRDIIESKRGKGATSSENNIA